MLTFGAFFSSAIMITELYCIMETDSLLLSVLLPAFDILLLQARTFFKSLGKNHYVSARDTVGEKVLFFATHSKVLLADKNENTMTAAALKPSQRCKLHIFTILCRNQMLISDWHNLYCGCSAFSSSLGAFNLGVALSVC